MKKRLRCFFTFVTLLGTFYILHAQQQNSISLDFRNQRITDILLSLAEIGGESIVFDDTVTGFATFRFADTDFETALKRFAEYARLYTKKQNGMYFVSRIFIDFDEDTQKVTLDAEDVSAEQLLRTLSRNSGKTVFYDSLPAQPLTVRIKDGNFDQVLRLIITKYPDYTVRTENGGFYIVKIGGENTGGRESQQLSIGNKENLFSFAASKTTLPIILRMLFSKAQKEYALLSKTSALLENLYYENKTFEQLLRLILEQANCDYQIENGIYYIFEIQRNDVLKQLKTVVSLSLENISAENVLNLLPADLNAATFIRVDKNTNMLYISGSERQIQPIVDFIKKIDVPLQDRYYKEFKLNNLTVNEAIQMIPKHMLLSAPVLVPGTASFITQVTVQHERNLKRYLTLIDIKRRSVPIHLRFIKSEELLKHLPPSINKDSIIVTGDPALIFFTGTETALADFQKDLTFIDRPKKQIRYQILVIQYQKTDSFNWSAGINIKKTDDSPASFISGAVNNLLDIKFDIISQLGFQFAAHLNAEIGENRARILADTTLNGISGEDIQFQNTSTYRYRDVAIDAATGKYTGTTREISSGLVLKVNGWVSGDEMITVNVDAKVSKQGSIPKDANVNTNPPSTSEKAVTTHVRTKSGTPVVIGGLLQNENDVTEKGAPLLGQIPVLGYLFSNRVRTDAVSEMVIYLVPFVEENGQTYTDFNNTIRHFYDKYVKE